MSMIRIANLTFGYDGSHTTIFDDVSFLIDTDWKLGFTGRNGRGKTTFLNLLLGKYEYSGTISASVTFEYFPFPVDQLMRSTREVLWGPVNRYRCGKSSGSCPCCVCRSEFSISHLPP